MISYLGSYVPNLSTVIKPLTDLLHSDSAWNWGPAQESSFRNVNQLITSAPVLRFFDPKLPIVVAAADASSYGLGGVLYQIKDNA